MTMVAEPLAVEAAVDADCIVVTVTLEDIRDGIQRLPTACALSRAARRMLGSSVRSTAMHADGVLTVATWRDERSVNVANYTSLGAKEWVYAFDTDRASVAPERFVFRRIPNV